METTPTFPRGVPRVDLNHRNARQLRLVRDAVPQVGECPVVESSTLLASGLDTVADAGQLFEGDGATVALRCLDDSLGDTMVFVLLKSGLFPADLFQLALGCPRALTLEVAPAMGVFSSRFVNTPARVAVPFAIDCEIDHAKVDTEHARGLDHIECRNIADDSEIPDALDDHQIDFALAKGEQGALPFAALVGNGLTPVHGPDGYFRIGAESEDTVIIGLGGIFLESAPSLTVELVSVGHLGDAAHGHLRRQTEFLPAAGIDEFMQGELAEDLPVPRPATDPVACGIGCIQSRAQGCVLRGSRAELDVGDKFHGSSIEYLVAKGKKNVALQGNFRFLSLLKEGVSTKGFL